MIISLRKIITGRYSLGRQLLPLLGPLRFIDSERQSFCFFFCFESTLQPESMRCSAQLLTGTGNFKEMKDKWFKGPCDETPIPILGSLYGFNVFSQDDWSSPRNRQQSGKRCEENIIVWMSFFYYSISVSIPFVCRSHMRYASGCRSMCSSSEESRGRTSFFLQKQLQPNQRPSERRRCLAQIWAFESWAPSAQPLSTQPKSLRTFSKWSVYVHRSVRHTATRPRTPPTRWWKPTISQPYSDIQIDDRIDLIFVYLN